MSSVITTARYIFKDLNDAAANINTPHDRPAGIHASEVASCLRKAQYTYFGAEKKHRSTAYWSRILRMGEATHNLLQDEFRYLNGNSGLKAEVEVNINPKTSETARKYNVYGHADVVLTVRDCMDSSLDMKILVEIKSISEKGFEELKSPKAEHVQQAMLYMKCLDIPVGWIIYWNKGTQVLSEPEAPFIFPFKESVWNIVENRILKVINSTSFSQQSLLDREEGMHCKFCSYAHLCQPKILFRRKKAEDPF